MRRIPTGYHRGNGSRGPKFASRPSGRIRGSRYAFIGGAYHGVWSFGKRDLSDASTRLPGEWKRRLSLIAPSHSVRIPGTRQESEVTCLLILKPFISSTRLNDRSDPWWPSDLDCDRDRDLMVPYFSFCSPSSSSFLATHHHSSTPTSCATHQPHPISSCFGRPLQSTSLLP